MSDQTVDYLRTNRDIYTREALTAKLIEAGNDPAAVEAAWTQLDSQTSTVSAPDVAAATATATAGHGPGAGTVILAILVALAYIGAIFLALVAMGLSAYVSSGFRVIVVAYSVAMIVAGVWSIARLLRTSSRAEGEAAIFVALAISVGLFVGLSGLCFVGSARV